MVSTDCAVMSVFLLVGQGVAIRNGEKMVLAVGFEPTCDHYGFDDL